MEVIALSKSIQISPRKIRLVADLIKNKPVKQALIELSLLRKRASYALDKTLNSAIANAINNAKLAEEKLIIKRIEITQGPAYKRFHPSTRGRIHPYKKKTSNIRIILEEGGVK